MILTMIFTFVLIISSMIYGIRTSYDKEMNEPFFTFLGIISLVLMIFGYVNSWMR